jgi:uncharacterized membrane protein YoaK (UPF0700 family)
VTAEPWGDRRAFVVGLTAAAGTLDALAFLYLGKVFNSFQSGNVLFLGLGAGAGNGGLVVRAGAVLVAFVAGAAVGSRLGDKRRVLAVEAGLLAAFAVLWLAIDTPADHAVARVVLLALGAAAMGFQASFAMALRIPNVLTVALTATLANLGERAGDKRGEHDPSKPSNALLIALCATYAICAAAIAVLPETPYLSLAPLVLLVGADRISAASAFPSRGALSADRAT